jgi:hypothetical protein
MEKNKENQKKWYAKNKEKRKEYYLKNRDIILKKLKEKRSTPEYKLKRKEINKRWYIKHYKEYRAKNLERIKKLDGPMILNTEKDAIENIKNGKKKTKSIYNNILNNMIKIVLQNKEKLIMKLQKND